MQLFCLVLCPYCIRYEAIEWKSERKRFELIYKGADSSLFVLGDLNERVAWELYHAAVYQENVGMAFVTFSVA